MDPKNCILRLLLFLVLYSSKTCGEFLSAMTEADDLLKTHKMTIDHLDHYIKKEEAKIDFIKRNLKQYKTEHDKAMEDITNYLGNLLNAFTLTKRLTTDLDFIEKSIQVITCIERLQQYERCPYMVLCILYAEYVKNMTKTHKEMKYPTSEDFSRGAALALIRLQNTYLLQVEELAEGKLNGVEYSTPMTASDCFELARVLYRQDMFDSSLEWMMVALMKYTMSKETHPFSEVDILEYIGYTHYLLGRTNTALKWTIRLLELDPNHQRARGNMPHYLKIIEEEAKKKKDQRENTGDPNQDKVIEDFEIKEINDYGSLCRGEKGVAPEISRSLKCWYETKNHPFLKYAAMKVEQIYIEPNIFIFHDVMSEDEIETIKHMSKSRFTRVEERKTSHGKHIPPYRTGKSAWLCDEESPVVERISRRITHMTGLSVESAEDLQVFNYGVGGHYAPHFDYTGLQMGRGLHEFTADRIATVMFYMSDVAQGGATVFPLLGLSLLPIKGAALFWLNLYSSGEGDINTLHAACPVLRGTKWVSNKWLHLGGQEFIRPCELEYRYEGMTQLPVHLQPATAR